MQKSIIDCVVECKATHGTITLRSLVVQIRYALLSTSTYCLILKEAAEKTSNPNLQSLSLLTKTLSSDNLNLNPPSMKKTTVAH